MSKLRNPLSFETAFGTYTVDELLGEGGTGRVYGGVGADGTAIALKVLARDRVSSDKRRRFKNEIAFLARTKHRNIVPVVDHGATREGDIVLPFYVMPRYQGNLRDLMREGIAPGRALPLFAQVLDGVEAAHLQGAVHRDLKPENILWDKTAGTLAIADFGVASFTADFLVTLVETAPGQRLANFQYAAPEQRAPGRPVEATADIYALGLILNEMFTGEVPYGTEPRQIGQVAKELDFLDSIVARMLRQAPQERPASIADLKALVQRYQGEAVSLQRLSKLNETVIAATEVDEPLALAPPQLIDADWENGSLKLTLDRPVSDGWVTAFRNMRSYTSVWGRGPERFSFRGNQAFVGAQEHEIQLIVDNFKSWLPKATLEYKSQLEGAVRQQEAQRREQLRLEREAEEQRLRIRRNIRI